MTEQKSAFRRLVERHIATLRSSKVAFAALILLAVIFAGAAVFTALEGFSIGTAIYFCIQTTADIGYGDIIPSSESGRVFDGFYMVFGISAIAYVITVLAELMGELTALAKRRKMSDFIKTGRLDVKHHGPISRFCRRSAVLWVLLAVTVVLVLFGGALMQHLEKGNLAQNWSFENAIYFMFLTMMTIGYGNNYPVTDGGRAVTCAWILTGIVIIGVAVGQAGELVARKKTDSLVSGENVAFFINFMDGTLEPCYKKMSLANRLHIANYLRETLVMLEDGKPRPPRMPTKQTFYQRHFQRLLRLKIVLAVFFLAVLVLIGGAVMMALEGWSFEVAAYFSVITITLVGYGHQSYYPTTTSAKIFIFFYLIIGVGFLVYAVGAIGDLIMEVVGAAAKRAGVSEFGVHSKDTRGGRFLHRRDHGHHKNIQDIAQQKAERFSQETERFDRQESEQQRLRRGRGIEQSDSEQHEEAVEEEEAEYTLPEETEDLETILKNRPLGCGGRTRMCLLRNDRLIVAFSVLVVLVLTGAAIVRAFEQPGNPNLDWTYGHAVYFMIVTLSTVGYGDFYPVTTGGRVFVCLYLFLGLGLVGVLVGQLGETMLRQTQKRISRGFTDPVAILVRIDDLCQLELDNVNTQDELPILMKYLRETISTLTETKALLPMPRMVGDKLLAGGVADSVDSAAPFYSAAAEESSYSSSSSPLSSSSSPPSSSSSPPPSSNYYDDYSSGYDESTGYR